MAVCMKKEVLVVFGKRKRPVTFSGDGESVKTDQKSLFNAIKVAFSDILVQIFLQVESKKWSGQIIDLTNCVGDGEVIHIISEGEGK